MNGCNHLTISYVQLNHHIIIMAILVIIKIMIKMFTLYILVEFDWKTLTLHQKKIFFFILIFREIPGTYMEKL